MTTQNVTEWRGQELLDNDGDKIGKIEEIYLDTQTNEPEWALVKTGLFGGKGTFVPLSQANPTGDGVKVPFEKSHVKDAPNIDPDGELSHSEERRLYEHYGMGYDSSSGSDWWTSVSISRGPSGTTGFTRSRSRPAPGPLAADRARRADRRPAVGRRRPARRPRSRPGPG